MRRITRLPYAAVVPAPLPLFPLNTPLVPGLVLPLHIFEPRYRELVEELLARPDEDDREFGIVAVRDGRDVAADGHGGTVPRRDDRPSCARRSGSTTAGSRS